MSALFDALLGRTRLIYGTVVLLGLAGFIAWGTMPRQEDPSFVARWGTLVVPFPGADAAQVERLVLDPLEDALARVPELRQIESTARSGVAILTLRLEQTVYDTDRAWDEVRAALATADLPPEAGPLDLDDAIGDPASVVALLTGADLLTLREAALALEDDLIRLPGVSRVDRVGDPGARIAVVLDPSTSRRLGLPPEALAAQLRARNVTVPGGTLTLDDRQLVLRPHGELRSVEEVARAPILLPNGSTVPLGEIARVHLDVADPPTERVHHQGLPAVGLAVVPELPQDLVSFGERVRATLDAAELPPEVDLDIFAFQPAQVAERLSELATSLFAGIVVVAGVLFLAMGARLGFVVSSVVPMVALSTVAVFAAGGGVLHQVSVAALVLALGLLVDNAIVVAEQVQAGLDEGLTAVEAARGAVRELAFPLGTATGTTVAAFTPMLLSTGETGDFTRSLPVVLITAIVLSYGFALLVTPVLSATWLRPARADDASRLDGPARRLAATSTRHPWRVLGAVGGALLLTAGLATQIDEQFFPLSDRPRLTVSVDLAEGTPLSTTRALTAELETALHDLPGVTGVTSFIGAGPPRFYYNLVATPSSPHSALVVVTTRDVAEADALLDRIRVLARSFPEATIVPKRLQQGPPVGAPVEIELKGRDLSQLHLAAEAVVQALRATDGAVDVRHDLGVGVPTLTMDIDDAWTSRHGLGRADVALALWTRTRGADAGVWRGGEEPTPIVVASPDGERTPPSDLPMLDVRGVPLDRLTSAELVFQPAAIRHVDGVRSARVQAELAPGATFGSVRRQADPLLEALDLPGVSVSWRGEAEGSADANGALLRALPMGVGLLLFFLLLEFDSVRRAGIILSTVPLAAVGVVPGLVLSGSPFGFMSLLGTIALVGIVVNNAIVLLEVVETERARGADIDAALTSAVRRRLRPILLTTGTTVAGMIPLAVTPSSLWPPLAWAMISGLLASTGLTLLVVPALYRVLLGGPPRFSSRWMPALALLGVSGSAAAAPITLDDALRLGARAPVARAVDHEAEAARREARAAWLAATGPQIGVSAHALVRDEAVVVETPFGALPFYPEQEGRAGVQVRIPLVQPGALARAPVATRSARALHADAARARQQAALEAGERFLDVAALEAQIAARQAHVEALEAVAARAADHERLGMAVPADRLRAEVALADARQQLRSLRTAREIAGWALGAALGREASVDVAWSYVEPAPVAPEAAIARAGGRPDLEAADRRIAAARAERGAILADALPSVSVYGQANWTDTEFLADDSWVEGGVELSWVPLAGGTRPSRAAAAASRVNAARSARQALELGVAVEVRAAAAALELALSEVEVRRSAVDQADEARRIVSERWSRDLATLTDVLQVEAEFLAQRTQLRMAEIETVRAHLRLRVATGEAVEP